MPAARRVMLITPSASRPPGTLGQPPLGVGAGHERRPVPRIAILVVSVAYRRRLGNTEGSNYPVRVGWILPREDIVDHSLQDW